MSVIEQTVRAVPAAETIKIDFVKYKLANGLEVILSEDHRLPIVAVNLWYHVGPANEKLGRTGFAHLFEHMMFQGSKHAGSQPFKVLETAGATQINGTTGFDRTNYFETMPAEQLELALWFESDRMAFLLDTLTARNLANQRDVVRNERRQGENKPYKLVEEELFRQLFPAGTRIMPPSSVPTPTSSPRVWKIYASSASSITCPTMRLWYSSGILI